MKLLFSLLFIALYTVSYGTAEHETDHTENPSISLDYDTVTQIIEALDPENEAEDQTTQVVLEVTPSSDAVADYVYSKPEDSFQKRKSLHEPGTRRHRPKKIVISSHIIDLPDHEETGVKPHYFPDESVDAEVEIPDAPCDTDETSYETLDSSVETAGGSHGFVGSLKGTPGVDYPNYSEIPLTSFTCADKKHIPGFYADVETRCQVFHVCYPHRRESFLCPIGTTFNQPIKACDYWYNGNCGAEAEHYEETLKDIPEEDAEEVLEIIREVFPEEEIVEKPIEPQIIEKPDIVEIPVEMPQPIIPQPVVVPIPKPVVVEPLVAKPVVVKKPDPLAVKVITMKKFLPVKAKVLKFAAPIVAAKAKIVAAKAPVTIAKTVPIVKLLKVAPVKAVAKKAVLKSAVAAPVLAKKALAKKILLTKVAKAKAAKKLLAKKVAISALTKKHLALSLLRMARGHKVALHGVRRRPVYYV